MNCVRPPRCSKYGHESFRRGDPFCRVLVRKARRQGSVEPRQTATVFPANSRALIVRQAVVDIVRYLNEPAAVLGNVIFC